MQKRIFETYDIWLASFIDYWFGGVHIQMYDKTRCVFYIPADEYNQELEERIKTASEEYRTLQDKTPAKGFRERYKELATVVGRMIKQGNNF